ncbi:MAG TPA: type IX secretion system membrane protein PorP/SprF [Ohtaekwangia sp.]
MIQRSTRSYRFILQAGLLLGFVLVCTSSAFSQQRVQFSQYMFNGLIINPAYAGAEEALSLTLMHRMQWTGIDGAPVTQTLSGHSLFRKKSMGLGFSLVNDKIGVHKNLTAMGSYAYHLPVSNSSWLSFGLQAGIHNRKSDYASLYDGSGNDPLVSASGLTQTSFDMGTGVYFRSPRLHVGLSAPELLPEKSVVNDSLTVHWDNTTWFLFSKYIITLNDHINLEPGLLVKYFPDTPISIDVNLNAVFYDAVSFGLSYRKDESVDFLLRAKVTPQFQFGYAYDYPTGEIPKTAGGSHELMLNYRFRYAYTKVDSPR